MEGNYSRRWNGEVPREDGQAGDGVGHLEFNKVIVIHR